MTVTPDTSPQTRLIGILLALGGAVTLSVNDVAVKFLSGAYPLHEIILFRAVIGLSFLMVMIKLSGTGFGQLRTRRFKGHAFRVSVILVSNVAYFLALRVMPLADAVAVAYVSPLFVTLLSVAFLGERIGLHRWGAILCGFVGVLIMVRPGQGVVQMATILVLISSFCYATSHMMTRRMRNTESAFTLSFYVQIGFVIVSALMGVFAGDGKFLTADNAALEFLLRPWVWPDPADIPVFFATGLAVSLGGLMVSQAYRLCEAGMVAGFEYSGMPMAILWGVVIFGVWPDRTAWSGITLIVGAGLYTLWRETVRRERSRFDSRSGRV